MEGFNWNQKYSEAIRRERAEIARRYNIRFGQTQIYCNQCRKPLADLLGHSCPGIRREREVFFPQSLFSKDEWRKILMVRIGDGNEAALEKFREWRDSKRTCERCLSEEKPYSDFCALFAVCKEADKIEEEKEVKGDGEREANNRIGPFKDIGSEEGSFSELSL